MFLLHRPSSIINYLLLSPSEVATICLSSKHGVVHITKVHIVLKTIKNDQETTQGIEKRKKSSWFQKPGSQRKFQSTFPAVKVI